MTCKTAGVSLGAVSLLLLSFCVGLRSAGPLDARAMAVGASILGGMGALGVVLALRSGARGAWVVAATAPASIAAAWCVAAWFAFSTPTQLVRYAGLWTVGMDSKWLVRLGILGAAHGLAAGIVLTFVVRAYDQARARPTLDGADRSLSWAIAPVALLAAASIPVLGLVALVGFTLAQLALAATLQRELVRLRWLASIRPTHVVGPTVAGVLPFAAGIPIEAGLYASDADRPYRGAGAPPVTLVSRDPSRTAFPVRRRIACVATIMLLASLLAVGGTLQGALG